MTDYAGSEPLVVRLAREYREALVSDMNIQVYTLAENWIAVESKIQHYISELLLETENMRQEGIAYENAVRELARYKSLRVQIHDEITRYNAQAAELITKQQVIYGSRGIDDAAALLAATIRDGKLVVAGDYFNRLPADAVEVMMGFLQGGAPLNELLANSFPGAWLQVSRALFEGLALGKNPTEIARLMVDGLGYGLSHATLIARTEIMRAYRTSSIMQYRESGITQGFQRLVAKDGACPACLASDGEYFPIKVYFTDHPNGRCTCIPVPKDMPLRTWLQGPEWFEMQEPEKQKAILGARYYEAWAAGKFEFSDLRSTAHSEIWGDSPAVTPLKKLLGEMP